MARIRARVWIEERGECVLGDGRARMLGEIDRLGSISAAAKALGMSYRNAWEHVKKMEQRLGKPLLERSSGGASGGGSRLTPYARKILRGFLKIRSEIEAFVVKRAADL